LVAAIMSFVVAFVTSRLLGPDDYGRLATANALVVIMVGVTDFGISTALVKFTSEKLANKAKVAAFFQSAFKLELALAALIVLALPLTPLWAQGLGGKAMELPILLGLVASIFLSLNAYANAVLQTYQRFRTMAILNIAAASLRAGLVVILALMAGLNLFQALLINLVVAAVSLVAGLAVIPKTGVKAPAAAQRQALSQMLHFGKWLVVSYSLNAVISRLDVVMLAHFRPAADVGHYAAALQLASVMPLLISSLTTVLVPKVAALPADQTGSYLRKVLFGAAVAAAGLLPFILLARPLILLVFGPEYDAAVVPFQLIMTSFVITLFINPPSLLFYRWNRPKILTYMNVATSIILVGLFLWLTPLWGPAGAAAALVINVVIAGILFTALLWREWQRQVPVEASGRG
jgi:O-antigen/teichoic acid export membrane protein